MSGCCRAQSAIMRPHTQKRILAADGSRSRDLLAHGLTAGLDDSARQGTARADYLKLDEMGMLGVTHMMMLDRRNLEIADILLNWVSKNVRKHPKRG